LGGILAKGKEGEKGTDFDEVKENPWTSRFEGFFRTQLGKDIERLVGHYPEKRSLDVDFAEIERYDYELADALLENPDYLTGAASEAISGIDIPALEIDEFRPHIRFFNLPDDRQPLLRDIGARHISRLVSVEGVVKSMSDVLPRLKMAVWECRRCGNQYRLPQPENHLNQPNMCECNHRDFKLVAEESDFSDYQRLEIQEPLELLKGSEQATNLDVYLSDDIVNTIMPGDRTRITGILRLRPPTKGRSVVYGRYLEATHIEETAREFELIDISQEEEKEITELASRDDIYELLIKSIAPNIYGHEIVKEAIALQLFGGAKKTLPGDSRIRGNIHVLLVGEPGMAKSMILQKVDLIAPKSVYTTGKTTSGAGLSATAVKDEFGDGAWTLKAGALVLANGGFCMVDELDKMDTQDRSALHESMEQGSISVAKAGIVTRFKTETSILAAANPKGSRFDAYENFIEQINLPASLISRFDLFFIIRDVLDRKKDTEIAAHILKNHQVGEAILQSRKGGKMQKRITEMEKDITPPIGSEMLKKYISYARQNIFPLMTDDSMREISDFYVNLREEGKKQDAYAATHRQLEALVRLSEASARVRLSNNIEKEDTERAIRLFKASLQEVAFDKETGRYDIDMIATGRSKAHADSIKLVLRIIKEKAQIQDSAVTEEVIEEAGREGLEKERVKDIISKLLRSGEVYSPRTGTLKPAENK
jgi:replicative DNA helicase Mcm